MEIQLPQSMSKKDIEKLIKKAFPNFKFYWTGEKSKPLLAKHKGSEITQAILKKNTFNAFAIRLKTYPDNSKFILWESTWAGVYFYLLMLITGLIPILVVLILLKITIFKTKEQEFEMIISRELKKNINI